jgi:hypothetical protein
MSQSDRNEVVDLIHRYFWLVDHGRAAETVPFFAENARLTFGARAPKPGTLMGKEIAAAMEARGRHLHLITRHLVSNILLEATDADTIESHAVLSLYRSETEALDSYPFSIADMHDVFCRVGDVWRIAARSISPLFTRPAQSSE